MTTARLFGLNNTFDDLEIVSFILLLFVPTIFPKFHLHDLIPLQAHLELSTHFLFNTSRDNHHLQMSLYTLPILIIINR